MKNGMLSVRLPTSLIDEIKAVSEKDHYLDLSEAVRSIIRNNWLKHQDPLTYQLKKLKEEITESIGKKNKEHVLKELQEIRDSILKKRGTENRTKETAGGVERDEE